MQAPNAATPAVRLDWCQGYGASPGPATGIFCGCSASLIQPDRGGLPTADSGRAEPDQQPHQRFVRRAGKTRDQLARQLRLKHRRHEARARRTPQRCQRELLTPPVCQRASVRRATPSSSPKRAAAGVGPACRADTSGGALGAGAWRGAAHAGALAHWWCEQFPLTPLWRATCARFMPPVLEAQLPGELITRFAGPPHEALMRLLVWLSPATVGRGQPAAIRLNEAG